MFSEADIPDLFGKVFVITGGNAGLGLQVAKVLYSKNAHVVIACRSKERAEKAVEVITSFAEESKGTIEYMLLDLASFTSIDAFIGAFKAKKLPLHVLINNAGWGGQEPPLTEDGIELMMGINHLGHFRLTMGLLPILKQATSARIVNVSSMAHMFANELPDMDEFTKPPKVHFMTGYSYSKLANVLFTRALARRLRDTKIYVNVCHPGYTQSEMPGKAPGFIGFINGLLVRIFGTTIEKGALSELFCAASNEIELQVIRGEYFGPTGLFWSNQTSRCTINKIIDEEMEERLWKWSEKMCK